MQHPAYIYYMHIYICIKNIYNIYIYNTDEVNCKAKGGVVAPRSIGA